jgi:hypothetical protein
MPRDGLERAASLIGAGAVDAAKALGGWNRRLFLRHGAAVVGCAAHNLDDYDRAIWTRYPRAIDHARTATRSVQSLVSSSLCPLVLNRSGRRGAPRASRSCEATVNCPEFLILRRTAAATYTPSGVEVCISISNPEAPDLVLSRRFKESLRLRFDDVDERDLGGGYFVDFNETHARDILAFVDTWRLADRIVVHCLAGLSRSPAVAIGLCEVFGWPLGTLEGDHPLFNRWIRKELVRVGREVVSDKTRAV